MNIRTRGNKEEELKSLVKDKLKVILETKRQAI